MAYHNSGGPVATTTLQPPPPQQQQQAQGGPVKGRKPRHDDEEQGKLFVGGLSWDTTQDTLLSYFGRFGEVIDCVVMKNAETGRSRGFGFVTFSDPTNIDAVLASGPHNLDGRTIDPKACNPRSMQKPKKTTTQHYPKVFLGGLPSSITETDLRSFFSRYGEVVEVVIMYDQEKKKSRGFGFLSFGDEGACAAAVSEHFVNIQNKQVEIKRAEPRTNQQQMNGAGDAKDYQVQQPSQPQQQQQHPPPPQMMAQWMQNGHQQPPAQHHPMGGPPPTASPAMPVGVQPPAHVAGGYAPTAWGAPPPGAPPPPSSHQHPVAAPQAPHHPAGYPAHYAAAPPAGVPPPSSASGTATAGQPPHLQWGAAPQAPPAPVQTQQAPPTAHMPPPPVAAAQWTPHGFSSPPPAGHPQYPTATAPGAAAAPPQVYPPPPTTPQQAGAPPTAYYGSPQPQVLDPYAAAAAAAAAAGMSAAVPHPSMSVAATATPPGVPKVDFGQFPPPSSSSSTSVPTPPAVSSSSAASAYLPHYYHQAAAVATAKPYGDFPVAAQPPAVTAAAAAAATAGYQHHPPVSHETSLGPQRGAAYGTQPSTYHPYRRT